MPRAIVADFDNCFFFSFEKQDLLHVSLDSNFRLFNLKIIPERYIQKRFKGSTTQSIFETIYPGWPTCGSRLIYDNQNVLIMIDIFF